jgi:pimeloyl-ACP methyl ester carboxylesterase
MSKLAYIGASVSLLVVVGCGSGSDGESRPRPSAAEPSATTAAPTAAESASGPVSARCGPPDVDAHWITLRGPNRNRLAAVVVGDGPVTAVFSHQTGVSGLCGFWPFAVWLAEEHGIRSVLLDHCGVGGSACADDGFAANRVAQLELAMAWARTHGAKRLSSVGASLGGTTVTVAAAQHRVDGIVNLSGPVTWIGLNARRVAPQVTEPTLLVVAPNDSVVTTAQFKALRSSLGSRTTALVQAPQGHGWELLDASTGPPFQPSEVAKGVAAWIQGDFAAT